MVTTLRVNDSDLPNGVSWVRGRLGPLDWELGGGGGCMHPLGGNVGSSGNVGPF